MAIAYDANGKPINTTNNSGFLQAQGGAAATPAPAQNLYLPPGETPLTGDVPTNWGTGKWSGRGDSLEAGQYGAWQEFAKEFGRNPTQQELSMLAPAFQGDKYHINTPGGNAAVAAYYQQQANTPQNIYKQQQSQYTSDAPKYADNINQIFKSQLGRDATADEKTHFGALVASGQDPYQVQQAIQQTQEYQNKQNTDFQNTLQNQLQGSNATYFQNHIMPSIQAQAANSGRSLDSSGVNSALASAAGQQNQGLQQFLAGVTAQNYGNSTQNAMNQYQNLMGQQYGLQNAGVSNQLANNAANTQYNQNLNMFQLQQQAYQNYLGKYGKTSGNALSGGLQGALSGGIAGAKFGLPGVLGGALAGGGLGAGAGASL